MGILDKKIEEYFNKVKEHFHKDELKPLSIVAVELLSIFFFLFSTFSPNNNLLSFISPVPSFNQRAEASEVFGFAPHWKIGSLDNVDYSTLTTLAYFDLPLSGNGTIDRHSPGYETFKSDKAKEVFEKAQKHGTKVVLTVTSMENGPIEELLDSPEAQKNAISEIVKEVKGEKLQGANVDLEYVGLPGDDYRNKFTKFVGDLTSQMHREIPNSRVTVSVYAASAMEDKLYDIGALGRVSDGIFMMAYDFAVKGSDNAIPTAPLYGHKEGKYWYDVSTAVEDFLKVMPANKLILGVPWYGYEYGVTEPAVNASTNAGYSYWYKHWTSPWYWVWKKAYYRAPSTVQTYATSIDEVKAEKSGWDDHGKVGWKAYRGDDGYWRMFFMEDTKSLGVKYDFAKSKNLGGVGIWALGFDEGKSDMWVLLRQKFGSKLADNVNSNN